MLQHFELMPYKQRCYASTLQRPDFVGELLELVEYFVVFIFQQAYLIIIGGMDVWHLGTDIPFGMPYGVDLLFNQVEVGITLNIGTV